MTSSEVSEIDVIFGNDGKDLILGGWGKDSLYLEA